MAELILSCSQLGTEHSSVIRWPMIHWDLLEAKLTNKTARAFEVEGGSTLVTHLVKNLIRQDHCSHSHLHKQLKGEGLGLGLRQDQI